MAVHDAEVGDGAHRFGVGQCQGKSGPIGQLPARIWDALAPLLGARRQREQHESYRCECARRGSRFPASQAASFSDRMGPIVSTWPHVLHR